ncbi:MAG: hypothetical protein JKY45_00340 [Emcibacter sp.]|nr:hypothetical protein [Emcibacter sp.]
MTKYRTIIISRCRNLILCIAIMAYGLPMTTMAAPSMMSAPLSVDQHCPDMMSPEPMSPKTMAPNTITMHHDMKDQGESPSTDPSCCDSGSCDHSCMGVSVAITPAPLSSLRILSAVPYDPFTHHLTAISLSGEQPPPQA